MPERRSPLGEGLLGPLPKAVRPKKRRVLARQARRTIRKAYASGFKDLGSQERKAKAVAQKRFQDNQYYNQWIATQSEQLRAHAEAADAQLTQQQQQIQQQAAEANQALRDRIVQSGQGNVGNVSNAEQAQAFNVAPEGEHAQGLIAAERTRTAQAVGTRAESNQMAQASNVAAAAANEFRRQHDLAEALKAIGGARQKLILDRAAETSKEVARLLDQEITKAGMQIDMRNLAAQLGLSLKELRLNKKRYKLDRRIQMGELALAKRAQAETERSNRADEDIRREDAEADARGDGDNRRERKQEQRELNRKVKHIVNNTVSAIAANPGWQALAAQDPNKLVKKLVQRGVAEPVFARAAVDLMYRNELSPGSVRALRNLGFDIPKRWLG